MKCTVPTINISLFACAGVILVGCHKQVSIPKAEPAPLNALEVAICSPGWPDVNTAISALPNDTDLIRCRAVVSGYAALDRGDVAEANGHFLRAKLTTSGKYGLWATELASRHPGNAIALLLAADSLARRGDMAAARKLLDQAAMLSPSISSVRVARAYAELDDNDREKALVDADFLAHAQQAASEGLLIRAVASITGTDLKAVGADLDACLKLQPDEAIAWNTRGVLNVRIGKLKEATAAFARAYEIAPELAEAQNNAQITQDAINRGVNLDLKFSYKHNGDWDLNTNVDIRNKASVGPVKADRGGIKLTRNEIVYRADGKVEFRPQSSKLQMPLALFGTPESAGGAGAINR